MRALLASLCALLCACGDVRAHGFFPTFDAAVRVPAEASVAGGFNGPPLSPDAGCIGCPPLADDGGACPATWDEATGGDAGLPGCPALECAYPQGTCVCFWGCGGPGGAVPAVGGWSNWSCTPATAECPSPPPEAGTTCGDSGAYCQYGPVCCSGSWWAHCNEGLWEVAPGTYCP